MNTFVYVDAFNLYYGSLKGTPYKWLNIRKMCELDFPKNQIGRIGVFTARVTGRPNDPDAPIRQDVFFRALRTLPNLEIVEGHFLSHPKWMPLANPPTGGPDKALVIKTEEKGSDVNLAVALLRDAYENLFEAALVISGDSDLLAPVEIVKNRLKKPVLVLNPQKKNRPCQVLKQAASFYRHLRPGILAASQFPMTMNDAAGTFSKPASW
jgi:hypothetical protein